MMPNSAPHRCLALASKDSNTGASSPDELEMTCKTSEVAVLLLARLLHFTGESRNLLLEIGSNHVCGRSFASLAPTRTATLHLLPVSTASPDIPLCTVPIADIITQKDASHGLSKN